MLARITNESIVLRENSLIAIDVSGSVDSNFVDRVLSIIKPDLKLSMKFCTFDSQLIGFYQDLNQLLESKKNIFGGGTELNSLMKFAYENSFEKVVIITDGNIPDFEYNDKIDLYWILDEGNQHSITLKGEKFILLKP